MYKQSLKNGSKLFVLEKRVQASPTPFSSIIKNKVILSLSMLCTKQIIIT